MSVQARVSPYLQFTNSQIHAGDEKGSLPRVHISNEDATVSSSSALSRISRTGFSIPVLAPLDV